MLERERLAATALGHGVAIPHPRQPRPDVVEAARLSVVFLDPPVDWAAIDRLPVHTAFLVLSPSTAVHLQLLSRIAYALREPGFDEFLLERPSKSELAQHLRAIHKDA
ncbi:MAG: PTS sugar transporter subunit IIA [Planctomycetes bacterium]|nr:PTS sugar transporter subunit IIA [Planctomycetota bacterium]